MPNENLYNPHVSVDCVVFGFDGEKMKVLLIERTIEENMNYIMTRNCPEALFWLMRIWMKPLHALNELTGLKNIYLSQFRSFGNPKRTENPRDILWLENTMQLKIGRIVTVAYVALLKSTENSGKKGKYPN
jgi:ADP-ribose pyrophosphatase YjhB (NUDIX family)